MLQQYLIKSRSFSRNLLKKTQTNLSLFLWLISVLLNCLEFHCQQAAEPPYPSGMSFSLILPGFLRAVNITKQRKPFPEQISEGPHRTTARQAGQHLGKPALAGSSSLLLMNCTRLLICIFNCEGQLLTAGLGTGLGRLHGCQWHQANAEWPCYHTYMPFKLGLPLLGKRIR